jgi:hypothetical protein
MGVGIFDIYSRLRNARLEREINDVENTDQNAELQERYKGSDGVDENGERLYSQSAVRSNLVDGLGFLATIATEISPMYGELPRLPDPEGNVSIPGSSTRDAYFNELADRYDSANLENFVKKSIAGRIEAGKAGLESKNMYQSFYRDKTVQPINRFYAQFSEYSENGVPYPNAGNSGGRYYTANIAIKPHHIKSVSFKTVPWSVKLERRHTTPIPVVTAEDYDFEFNVTFEEDAYGTVFNFINNAFSKLIGAGPVIRLNENSLLRSFSVLTLNESYNVLTDILFDSVYILDAGDMTFDYGNETGIREFTVRFGATSRRVRTLKVEEKSIQQIQAEYNTPPTAGEVPTNNLI